MEADQWSETSVDDIDSALGDGTSSTGTQTISSSVYDYRIENGRTYHAFRDGAYWGPNDEQANEHLDLAHALFTKTFRGKLYLAPIPSDVQAVLDLGTGTGIWAIDFADENPQASVIGTDLSPIQPAWAPSNCKFEIDDMESDWTFGENRFDFDLLVISVCVDPSRLHKLSKHSRWFYELTYSRWSDIHLRTLHGSIEDWSRLYSQIFRALKPGGYVEQAEYSPKFIVEPPQPPLEPDNPISQWNATTVDWPGSRDLEIYSKMPATMAGAGLEGIQLQQFRWPLGPWPKDKELKEIGIWARAHADIGLENWTTRVFTTVLGWSVEQVLVLCAGVRAQLKKAGRPGGPRAVHQMNVCYGRKPGGKME